VSCFSMLPHTDFNKTCDKGIFLIKMYNSFKTIFWHVWNEQLQTYFSVYVSSFVMTWKLQKQVFIEFCIKEFIEICWQIPILVEITAIIIYLNTYVHFCTHLTCNSLNISQSEKHLNRSCKEKWNIFYPIHLFHKC
jgi:hypothetical protein